MITRKAATLLVSVALALGLVGAGISANYTDSGTATQNVQVGTFDIEIASTAVGALVVNESNPSVHSVTLTVPEIQSSAAGNIALPFTVKNIGTIGMNIHVTMTTPMTAPFTSLLVAPVADLYLSQNQIASYAGGISWPMLVNADLGKTATITYTATAGEGLPSVTPTAPTVVPQSAGLTNGGITIPSVPHVSYFIGGVAATAGFNQRPLGTYTVTATVDAGYQLVGPASWSLTVANAANVRPVTLTGSSVYIASYATGPAPVVNAAAQTITWTIPVNTVNTPTYEPIPYFGQVPNPIIGRFTATSPGATIGQTVSATVSPSLTPQAAKFNLFYRSTSQGGERTLFTPNKVLNVAPFAYSTLNHHATDNGVGVMWTGLTAGSTGTVTIVMSFYAAAP